MATKAAKSITINATKYELANKLDYQGGKVQLKAKDVLLSEVEVSASPLIVNVTFSGSTATADVDYADVIDAWYSGRTVIIKDSYGYPAGIGDVKVVSAYYNSSYETPYDYTVIGCCTANTADASLTISFRPHYDSGTDAYLERTWDFQRYEIESNSIIFNITCANDDGDNYPSTSSSDYSLASIKYGDGTAYTGDYSSLMYDIKSGKYDVKAIVRLNSFKYVYPLAMASDRAASYEYEFTSTYAYATDIRMDLIKVYGWSSTLSINTVLRKTIS